MITQLTAPYEASSVVPLITTLTAGYEASSAAPLMVFMQVPYENEFIAKTFVIIKALWFAKARITKPLYVGYTNTQVLQQSVEVSTGFATLIEKPLKLAYEQTTTRLKTLGLHYALTYPVSAGLRGVYDLLNVNRLTKTTSVPATFEGDINAYFAQQPNASIIGVLGSIDPIRMEVSTSITESVWQVNAQIPYDQSPKAILGERAIASFNALSFSVEFAGKSRSVNVSSDTVNIEAYSPTRSLAFEPAPNFSGKKAIRTLKELGVNDVIGLADSDIKNTTANQTKLSLINAIAADMGAALMSDPSAKLNVIPSWKASGQQWTVNEDMILEYNEVFVDGPAYNRIVVSDSNSIASGLRTEVVKDEANVDDWLIYVYGGVNVSVSHTQEYGSITPLGDQVLIKSEQVELINGVANLGYEATALMSVDWLHNQINSPLYVDGQRLLCGSDGDFALVKVDYSVKATVFKLTYSKDDPIQLVIKGD